MSANTTPDTTINSNATNHRPMSAEDLDDLYLSQCELAGIEKHLLLEWEDDDQEDLNLLRPEEDQIPSRRQILAYIES
jgi:hypothetical protein